MNLQQLRSVQEAVRSGFNLTEAALILNASPPGVSRQIRDLEDELGIALFVRSGKRLTGLTQPGAHVLPIIERLLTESLNLKNAGEEFVSQQSGTLSIATTHSQARYAMPIAVQEFRNRFPDVRVQLHQGSPDQVKAMIASGRVDVAIATEGLASDPQLISLPCYRWTHCVLVLPGHPLLDQPLTLGALAEFPLMTYVAGFTGRTRIDEAFNQRGLKPDFTLTAMDADVIKTYVELGLGVGIVSSIAFDEERDTKLRAIDGGGLFGVNVTRLAVRRGTYLRRYVYDFVASFAPQLSPELLEQALKGGDSAATTYDFAYL